MAEWSPGSKSPLMEKKVGWLEGSTLEATLQKKERIVGLKFKSRDKEEKSMFCKQLATAITKDIHDWTPIFLSHIRLEQNHVIVYEPGPGKDHLNLFITECSHKQAAGVVLINPINTSQVNFRSCNYPVYLVNDGKAILDICHSGSDVMMMTKVEKPSNSHAMKRQSIPQSGILKSLRRNQKLPDELDRYVRQEWHKVLSASDAQHFLCGLYYQLCTHIEEGRMMNHQYFMKHAMTVMFTNISNDFQYAFPVYFFALSQVLSNKQIYFYEEGVEKIKEVMKYFKTLTSSQIMATVELYDHIKGKEEMKKSDMKALLKGISFSYLHVLELWSSQEPLTEDFLFLAISIIIISQRGQKDHRVWENYLLKQAPILHFHDEKCAHIEGLRQGLCFQRDVEISPDYYFSPKHLLSLVHYGNKVCTLLEAGNIIEILPAPGLQYGWRKSFITDFLIPLKNVYSWMLKQTNYINCNGVSSQGSWKSVLVEGLKVMEAANKFMTENNCTEKYIEHSFKWLKLMIKTVQFNEVHSHEELLFLFNETEVVKPHQSEVNKLFLKQFKGSFNYLEPVQFLTTMELLEGFSVTDSSIFGNYFEHCDLTFAKESLVCSQSLFVHVIREFTSKKYDEIVNVVVEFFSKVYDFYKTSGSPLLIFVDLIQSDFDVLVTQVAGAEEEILKFLHSILKKTPITHIINCLPSLMQLPSQDSPNQFQWLVCAILLEGLGNWKIDEITVNLMLNVVHKHFQETSKDFKKFVNNPRTRFVCGVVYRFCLKINFHKCSWLDHGPVGVRKLVKIVKPLYEQCEDSSIPEIKGCVQFYIDVEKKLKTLGDQINNRNIKCEELRMLQNEDYYKQIRLIAAEVKVTAFKQESLAEAFKELQALERNLNNILIVSFKMGRIYLLDSLIRILNEHRISMPVALYQRLNSNFQLDDLEKIIKEPREKIPSVLNVNDRSIVEVRELHSDLSNFLGALKTSLHIFCFFHVHNSDFFSAFIKKNYFGLLEEREAHQDNIKRVQMLSFATEEVICLAMQAVNGELSLKEMGMGLSPQAGKELATLQFFVQNAFTAEKDIDVGYKGYESLYSMHNVQELMQLLDDICRLHRLKKCQDDPIFKMLYKNSERMLNPEDICLKQAIQMRDQFCNNLPNVNGKFTDLISLFKEVIRCVDCFEFCRKLGFAGEKGKRLFLAQYNLITQEINDLHEQRVLDDLWVAYNTLFFFLDENIEFQKLTNGLCGLGNLENRRMHMQALRKHEIVFYEEIFNKHENQSDESIAKQLEGILEEVHVKYRATAHSDVEMEIWKSSTGNKWDLRDVSEFAERIKLAQVDMEENDNSPLKNYIEHFLKVHEISWDIFNQLQRLKLMGHFDYQEFEQSHQLVDTSCINVLETLSSKFKMWETDTPMKREDYKGLSFFSNHKILQLYTLLKGNRIQEISDEITNCMLYSNTLSNDEIKLKIVESLKVIKSDDHDRFVTVGKFLNCFQEQFIVESPKCQRRESMKRISNYIHLYILTEPTYYIMYSSAMKLLRKAPVSFQVLPCTSLTTMEMISLFFLRAKYYQHYKYMIIGINNLPSNLQEVIVKECINLREYENKKNVVCDISIIENGPSLMRTMPWCLQAHVNPDEINHKCEKIECELVHGHAGNGKTHYIKELIKRNGKRHLSLSVNEEFHINISNVIVELNSLVKHSTECQLHLNFTLPFTPLYSLNEEERKFTDNICNIVNWFFFSMLILGYVEDPKSAKSFSMNQLKKLHVYVEIPVMEDSYDERNYLLTFNQYFPVFSFIGKSVRVLNNLPYIVDTEDEMLVCKYLKAEEANKLDKLYRARRFNFPFINQHARMGVQISDTPNLSENECSRLLGNNMPHPIRKNKVYQRLFVSYLYRRCAFLDDSTYLRYYKGRKNPTRGDGDYCNPKTLRSCLLRMMKTEVIEMCQSVQGKGFQAPHLQLIYTHGNLAILPTGRSDVTEDEARITRSFEFPMPSIKDLKLQSTLKEYLFNALQLPENSREQPSILESHGYVLTLDYLLKMLSVHERQQCGMPVIISGETGVGKTFLLETLSKLHNSSHTQLLTEWRKQFQAFLDIKFAMYIKRYSSGSIIFFETEGEFDQMLSNLNQTFKHNLLNEIYAFLNAGAQKERVINSLLPLLENSVPFPSEFNEEEVIKLIKALAFGQLCQLFFVEKIHSGQNVSDIRKFLQPIIRREEEFNGKQQWRVTVFFDEVNTSSCLGFLKEIIIDHTMDGKRLPKSMFIVAASNPYRGNSLTTISSNKTITDADSESWFKGSYLVHPMVPSLNLLMWDFGALDADQESDYIDSKLALLDQSITAVDRNILKAKIALSQRLLRKYTREYLKRNGENDNEAELASTSCVSQRDIQRVLKLYQWLKRSFKAFKKYGYSDKSDDSDESIEWELSERALYISIALVYFFRLNKEYRETFAKEISMCAESESTSSNNSLIFTTILDDELQWLMEMIELPPGIAYTQALKENLYTIIVCCMTRIPLIITGPPGSSKTLSFKIALANMLGEVSPNAVFRNKFMNALDPHIYQCSKHSTANDIEAVFSKAVSRQEQIQNSGQTAVSVVFIDEAGLPEENLQVLKVLHYHLDNPKVAFVALTNRILDAAKSNRAVCLFQVNTSQEDVQKLAEANMSLKDKTIPDEVQGMLSQITGVYCQEMLKQEFNSIFGLRDLMHLFSFLRRNLNNDVIETQTMELLKGLQRNFSGTEKFIDLAKNFLKVCGITEETQEKFLQERASTLSVLKSSIADKPEDLSFENEVRYKLLIDHSEDESLVRFLFKFGVLKRKNTKIYACSKLPNDRQLQKVITLTRVKNSVSCGHTVVLSQCDEIFESLYDLFNQRFTCIDDHQNSKKYYARIAVGAKIANCLVNPDFQCVVVIKKSELPTTPTPFLNRFEKFHLSHQSFLDEMKKQNNPALSLLFTAGEKVAEFFQDIPPPGIFGQQKYTLLSLMMTHISSCDDSNLSSQTLLTTPCGDTIWKTLSDFVQGQPVNPDHKEALEIFEDITYTLSIMKEDDFLTKSNVDKAQTCLQQLDTTIHSTIDENDVYLVLKFISQFLIVRLTKEIMQLMPPEVFLGMKDRIPDYYVNVYLKHQTHFSLQDMVAALPLDCNSRSQNKTLCFCRSSADIFESLPKEYFAFSEQEGSKEDIRRQLEILFPTQSDLDAICVLQILSENTGDYIRKKLRRFLTLENYDILVMLVNTKDISKDSINYLRILIEELEQECNTYKNFILLIHFPPENFFDHCYPALFLDGWSLYYLDAVAPSTKSGIHLKRCFEYCFSKPEVKLLEQMFQSLFTTDIPFLMASSVAVLQPEIHSALATDNTLFSLSNENSIGNALFRKFCKLWTPKKMMQLLQYAGNSSLTQEYTLSMTDAVSTLVKSRFYDFMYYMLTILNKHGALSALLDKEDSVFLTVVQTQIEHYPLPHSSAQIKIDSATILTATESIPKFPFFRELYDTIEEFLKVMLKKTSEKLSVNDIQNLSEELERKTQTQEGVFTVSIMEMDRYPLLWEKYMLEFLSLFYKDVKYDSDFFRYFYKQASVHCHSQNSLFKLVWLHSTFAFTPVDVLNILKLFAVIGDDGDQEETYLSGDDVDIVAFLKNKEATAEKIIESFFSELNKIAQSPENVEKKKDNLLNTYNDLFFKKPTKDLLYVEMSPQTKAKRDAIVVFFTLIKYMYSDKNTFYTSLALLKHFHEDIPKESQEIYGVGYFIDTIVLVMFEYPSLQQLLAVQIPSNDEKNHAIGNTVEGILSCLLLTHTESQNQSLRFWLYQLFKGTDHSCLSSPCKPENAVNSSCFLYHVFSTVSDTTGMMKQYEESESLTYIPFVYSTLQSEVDGSTDKSTIFLTLSFFKLLEKMQASKSNQLGHLVREFRELSKCKTPSHWDVVHTQAVVQEIIQSAAINIVHRSDDLISEVNELLNKQYIEQNGLMLVYRILKCCKSYRELRKFLQQDQYQLTKHYGCLENICEQYPREEKYFEKMEFIDFQALFPVFRKRRYAMNLYEQISISISDMAHLLGQINPLPLSRIMTTCFSVKSESSWERNFFKMSILLSVYNNFFKERIQSPECAEVIKMNLSASVPSTHTQIIGLFVNGGVSTPEIFDDELQRHFNNQMPTEDEKDMWCSAAKLIGIILGSKRKSNHFWYHLFEPRKIAFIPGATCEGRIGSNEMFYDEKTDLTDSGYCSSQQSYLYVTRGKMSLPSLYLIQWANYTCLCIHLLANSFRNVDNAAFNQYLFSDQHTARDTCLQRMKKTWKLMVEKFNITTEERMTLIDNCLWRLHTKWNSQEQHDENLLDNQNDLDKYENEFHEDVFVLAWKQMLLKREEIKKLVHSETIQAKLLKLESICPVFAEEETCLTFVLSSTHFQDKNSPFYVLYHFLLMRPVLDAGIRILPDLVDFYQWIHIQFSHSLTRKQTEALTLSEFISNQKESGGHYVIEERIKQFQMICDFTKHFKDILFPTGNVTFIKEETLLSDIISVLQSPDLLLLYIEELVNMQNGFLDDVNYNGQLSKVIKVVPFTKNPIMGVDDLTDLMPLIRKSCCVMPSCHNCSYETDPSLLEGVVSQVYNLHKLQDDIIATFISEMKRLEPISTVSMQWQYKLEDESVANIFVECAAIRLGDIHKEIPIRYQVEPHREYVITMEINCHSLSYASLLEVSIGLRIAAFYLVKALRNPRIPAAEKERFARQTLPEFLRAYTKSEMKESADVIKDVILVDMYKLTKPQRKFLEDLLMIDIMKTLRIFVKWLQEGMYDFSSLPFTLKEELEDSHKQKLEALVMEEHNKGRIHQLHDIIKKVCHILAQSEINIRNLAANDKLRDSLRDSLPMTSQKRELFNSLPDVGVRHYVKLSLSLRKMQIDISRKLVDDNDDLQNTVVKWDDVINEEQFKLMVRIQPPESCNLLTEIPKALDELTTKDIEDFMKKKGISEEYVKSVVENKVEGNDIKTDNDKRLKLMLGMRNDPTAFLYFKVSIMREFGGRTIPEIAITCPPSKTAQFCKEFPVLRDAAKVVQRYQLDGEMLLEADDDVLKHMSKNPGDAKKIIETKLREYISKTY